MIDLLFACLSISVTRPVGSFFVTEILSYITRIDREDHSAAAIGYELVTILMSWMAPGRTSQQATTECWMPWPRSTETGDHHQFLRPGIRTTLMFQRRPLAEGAKLWAGL